MNCLELDVAGRADQARGADGARRADEADRPSRVGEGLLLLKSDQLGLGGSVGTGSSGGAGKDAFGLLFLDGQELGLSLGNTGFVSSVDGAARNASLGSQDLGLGSLVSTKAGNLSHDRLGEVVLGLLEEGHSCVVADLGQGARGSKGKNGCQNEELHLGMELKGF